jgi:superfamily II DNA or RNA helicase
MSSIIQILHNPVVAKLKYADHSAQLAVSELLSYAVSGAEFTDRFRDRNWDGRQTLFDFATGRFPAGFVPRVLHHLQKLGYTVQSLCEPLPAPLGLEGGALENFDGLGGDTRYGYQKKTVDELERRGRLIAMLATGSGKSRVASMAYARIKRPTLFLTTRGVLLYQIKTRFEKDHGIQVGVIGDSVWDPRNGITCAMIQTLASLLIPLDVETEIARWNRTWKDGVVKKLETRRDALIKIKMTPVEIEKILAKELKAHRDRKPDPDQVRKSVSARVEQHNKRHRQTLDLLGKFEFVIGEEAHEAGGNGYYNVIQACKNAHYRLALTATPFMRSDGEDNMRLMAAFGEIGIRVTEKQLIDAGILAKPYFKYIDTERPKNLYRTTGWQRAYKYGIVENPHRNGVIVNEALRAKAHGLPTLILVQHTRHGELLKQALKQGGATVEFIHGAHEQEEREYYLNALANRQLDILIGSVILDVGVDVPAVGVIILAGGGKTEVALRQRIGRGLRAKKQGPNVAFILDFIDSENEHLREHAKQRRAIVQQTPGFAEGILAPGQDFDYSIF